MAHRGSIAASEDGSHALRVWAVRGREEAELEQRLLAPDGRGVVLAGPAGAGKTALLQRVLRRAAVRRRFGEATVWLLPQAVAWSERRWARAIRSTDTTQATGPQPARSARSVAPARSVVVIEDDGRDPGLADDLERFHSVGGARIVRLARGAPSTDRSDVMHVRGLPIRAGKGGAADLLAALWRGFPLDDATALELVALVDGNPLGITLLAGASASWDGPSLLERFRSSAPMSGVLDADVVMRLDLVSRDVADARSLCALSVFPASFTAAAAATVAGATVDRLSAWERQGWIVATATLHRWTLPAAVRAFLGGELQRASGEADRVEARFAAYLIAELGSGLEGGFDVVDIRREDVDGFCTRLLVGERFHDLGAAGRLLRQWARSTARVDDAYRWFHLATQQAEALGAEADAIARLELAVARCDVDLDRVEVASALGRQAVARLPEDHPLQAEAYGVLGAAAFGARRYLEAATEFERSLELSAATEREPALLAALLGNLGQAWSMAGNLVAAEGALRRAISMKQASQSLVTALTDLNALGLLLLAAGRDLEAAAVLRDALRVVGPRGDREMRVFTLHSLAVVLLEIGDAARAYEAIVDAFEEIVPDMHAEVDPLARLTWWRAAIYAPAGGVTAAAAAEVVAAGVAAGGTTLWYTVLAVAEELAVRRHDVGAARSLLGPLLSAPVEAHVATIVRRRWRRWGGDESGGSPTPPDPVAMVALLRRLVPDLLGPMG